MSVRPRYCEWCGEYIGDFAVMHWDPPPCCGKRECERELDIQLRAEQDERRHAAEDDEYRRY